MTETERNQIKGALLKCAEENENKSTLTGHIVVSSLCKSAVERIAELEKENAELKQAKTIAQLNLDNNKLVIENERLHKENIALKEIKELLCRTNKEQSVAILELKMQIEELKSSSKHWEEAE